MTDYRFKSNRDVVLRSNESALDNWYNVETGDASPAIVVHLIRKGIIEPVPVEIPEHVIEAAVQAYRRSTNAGHYGWMRDALIAAKQAEATGP